MGLVYGGTWWVDLDQGSVKVKGEGRVQPRLVFTVRAKTDQPVRCVRLLDLRATLRFQKEVLGYGFLREGTTEVGQHAADLVVDVPISLQALHYVQDAFRDHTLHLTLTFSGVIAVPDCATDTARAESREGAEPKTWTLVPIRDDGERNLGVSIARSDWFKLVLEPIGIGRYVLMELVVPDVPHEEAWTKALDHLRQAEEQFASGKDPGVFQYCKAAFEEGTIPGAPQHILDSITDRYKRERVNKLLHKATEFLHAGRHVAHSGTQAGTFAVDHRDAEFALGLSKMFLAYVSKLLS